MKENYGNFRKAFTNHELEIEPEENYEKKGKPSWAGTLIKEMAKLSFGS